MSEINVRWQRDHLNLKRMAGYLSAIAFMLWPVTYSASYSAETTGQGMWFSAVSVVTLLAAFGVTGAAGVVIGVILTDNPPLPGDNH